MAKDKPPTYTPAPEPPKDPELRRRYDAIMSVIADRQTVTAAAESLGMSRNHFQTILHRVIAAIIETLTPKPAGRPAKPPREAELEAENDRLRAELAALQERSAMIDRLMNVVGGIASGREPLPRSRGKSKKKPSEDPEPATTIHQAVTTMRDARVPMAMCAKVMGVSEATARRRLATPAPRHERAREVDQRARQHVRDIVRATHGLVGAASLGKRCGLPRRAAAAIKKCELREMELERKARCAAVTIAAPGIVRGFDAMHLNCRDGKAYWLVAADAAVPYRTSITTVPVYDAEHVIAALLADFEKHGVPLVLRMDRIACQRTAEVLDRLSKCGVLVLHGPPRHPYYYGQLERQNREHRAWHRALGETTRAELAAAATDMRTALNTLWSRPTLDWCTAEEAWQRRQPPNIDRRKLRHEVEQRTSGLVTAGIEPLHASRIAIETALTERGLLNVNQGGWC